MWAGGALPKASRGRQHSGIAHVADIYATLAAAAKISAADLTAASTKGPAPLDSISLWSVLQDPTLPSPRTEVLIYGQGWHPDAEPYLGAQATAALNCSSSAKPSGMAFHGPKSITQSPAANKSAAAAGECAAACCAQKNCTGWMLTTPEHLQPPCQANEPCCWLVYGGKLSPSSDSSAYSGASGRQSPPPSPKTVSGALRSQNFKVILGSNKYAGWYQAPEDDNETALKLARTFCKLGATAPFPPSDAPNCKAPGCLFKLDEDPCELHNLADEQPDKLAEMIARLHTLSANPVPYDSCLPGCTATKGCTVAKELYSNFFGPYFPPVQLLIAEGSGEPARLKSDDVPVALQNHTDDPYSPNYHIRPDDGWHINDVSTRTLVSLSNLLDFRRSVLNTCVARAAERAVLFQRRVSSLLTVPQDGGGHADSARRLVSLCVARSCQVAASRLPASAGP